MRASYTLYRAETAGALAQVEAAREKIETLNREIAALRIENARLRRASAPSSGEYPRLELDVKQTG